MLYIYTTLISSYSYAIYFNDNQENSEQGL